MRESGIDVIFLLAPTSADDRVRYVVDRASGFLYLVSLVVHEMTGLSFFSCAVIGGTGDDAIKVGIGTTKPLWRMMVKDKE